MSVALNTNQTPEAVQRLLAPKAGRCRVIACDDQTLIEGMCGYHYRRYLRLDAALEPDGPPTDHAAYTPEAVDQVMREARS